MANVIPWLVSMSLLGGTRQYVQHTGPDLLSRELQAPLPSIDPTGYSLDVPRHFPPCDPSSPETTAHRKPTEHQDFAYTEFNSKNTPISGRALDSFTNAVDPNSVRQISNANLGNVDLTKEAYKTSHKYTPPKNEDSMDEYAGPSMELVFSWDMVDFEFGSKEARRRAIFEGEYIPENCLPLGLELWRDKVFVTLPRWKEGIPVTLATVSKNARSINPKLQPYPSWDWHQSEHCKGLTSVFRVQVDECDRLWVLDSGQVNVTSSPHQICPPQVFVFDLKTDTLLRRFALPPGQIKQDSLYSNIVVDVRNGNCGAAVAYLSDVWRFGLVAYDYSKDTSFRIQHHFFFPDPLSSRYELHGLHFQWTDGIFGIALSPIDINGDRTLFFHPMSSFREFAVSTSVLRDEKTADDNPEKFVPIGRPRAKDFGHSSGSAIDKDGVMFFNMVTRDSVWCWDTRKEYIPQNLGVVGQSNVSLVFPNDIKVDHEDDPSVWILSNRLPMYLYGHLDSRNVNYRIFKANIKEAIRNTVCDPNYVVPKSEQGYDNDTC
ncbi:protein yellow isoform X2 [Cephus cinctus]|nr:protein yellow isoform X2 [Cephus cinctus]